MDCMGYVKKKQVEKIIEIMRKLLLGTANNIPENRNKVKLWYNSFKSMMGM